MENQVSEFKVGVEVYERLFERFYANSGSGIDEAASSHWKEFSKFFSVTKQSNGKYFLNGYGFGGQDRLGRKDRLYAFIGNTLQFAWLKDLGLINDIIAGYKTVRSMGLPFSQDAFRQVCTLHLIKKKLEKILNPQRILVIGDGPGILSALLFKQFPDAQIILADLGQVLFFQSYQLKKAFPDAQQWIADEDVSSIGKNGFVFCPADHIDSIPKGQIDLTANVASMQEMDPSIIENYFKLIRERNTRFFYNCNRLEKRLVGGEITRFMEYPWKPEDIYLVDEICPWHQWFFEPKACNAGKARYKKITVPYIYVYDGPHWHRLAQLSN